MPPHPRSYEAQKFVRFINTTAPSALPKRAAGGGAAEPIAGGARKKREKCLGARKACGGDEKRQRREAKEDKAAHPKQRLYDYIVSDDGNAALGDVKLAVVQHSPPSFKAWRGLAFCLEKVLEEEFSRLLGKGRLTLPPPTQNAKQEQEEKRPVELEVVWGFDGITPVTQGVVGMCFAVLDRAMEVLASGSSGLMFMIVAWASEKESLTLAPIANQQISELCMRSFELDGGVPIRFVPKWLFGDGKACIITAGLSGGVSICRCFLCDALQDKWGKGLDLRPHGRTLATFADCYLASLFAVLHAVHKKAEEGSKLCKTQALALLTLKCKENGGVHNFHAGVSGNKQALREMRLTVTRLLWPATADGDLEAELEANARVVESRLQEMLALDSFLRGTPRMVFPTSDHGFPTSAVQFCPPLDHPLKQFLRSLILDYALAQGFSGNARQKAGKALLGLCGADWRCLVNDGGGGGGEPHTGNQKWFDRFYTKTMREILAKAAQGNFLHKFDFPIPQRQVVVLAHLVSGMSYQSRFSAFDRAVFRCCCSLVMPLLSSLLELHFDSEKIPFSKSEGEKVVTSDGKARTDLYSHEIEHWPDFVELLGSLIATNEGQLDELLGRLQTIIRNRGGGGKDQLQRCLELMQDEFAAHFGWGDMAGGKRGNKGKGVKLPPVLVRPLVFEKSLLVGEFKTALDSVTAALRTRDLARFVHEVGGSGQHYSLLVADSDASGFQELKRAIEGSALAQQMEAMWLFCACPGKEHEVSCAGGK